MQISYKTRRSLISMALMLLAVTWISLTLRNNIGQVITTFDSLELRYLTLSLIPAVLMVFITAHIYSLILSRIVPSIRYGRNVMMHFIVSQVVRYLPGKVWGIVYQTQVAEDVESASIVKANIMQFVLFSLNSVAIAIGIYAYYYKGITIAVMVLAALMSLVFLVSRASTSVTERPGSLNNNKDLITFGLLQSEWFFYLTTCSLILPGHFSLGDTAIIASNYVMAWVAGALASILPAGLLVREASFVWLSGLFGFDPVEMFTFSVVARTLFTIADLASAVLSMALLRTNAGVKVYERHH